MLGAFLTTIFWAYSAVCGQRAARNMGSMAANAGRLLIALAIVGVIVALFYRDTFHASTFLWLSISGLLGFGLGDIALYFALARLGSRLTVLITFCASPIIAAIVEWVWLGTVLPPAQIAGALIIMAGVCATLRPSSPVTERYGSPAAGLAMSLLAALGQSVGAVMTRVANEEAAKLGTSIPALSQVFQRLLPGTLVAVVAMLIVSRMPGPRKFDFRRDSGWLIGASLGGPIIGAAFYQWGLQQASSAVVLAIVNLTPVVVMPIAYFWERDRPSLKAVAGGMVAIAGAILVGLG